MSNYRLGPNERFEDIYEERTEEYATGHLFHMIDQLIKEAEPAIEELEKYWPIMPRVEANGNSECPFAEDMYRKKQKLEQKVVEHMTSLQGAMRRSAQEVERCKRNLSRISVDARKLDRPEARKHYTEAWGRQEEEYVEAIGERQRVDAIIRRGQATLAASQKKAYPMPLTEKMPTNLSASASSYDSPAAGTAEDRVGDMLSLGRF